MLTREWFSAAELAALALPGLPGTKGKIIARANGERWHRDEWKDELWRARKGQGAGFEYHYSVLPSAAQIKLAMEFSVASETDARAAAKASLTCGEMWAWFDRQPAAKKAKAQAKLQALDAVQLLCAAAVPKTVAMAQVAAKWGVRPSSLYNWEALVADVKRADWLPYLAPRHAGRSEDAACSPEAWEFLKADYLRPAQPTFLACFRRLEATAKEQGWTIPAARTLERRIEALPEALRVLSREGIEALKRLYPAQQRDRGVFHALEAVNADGHRWDVFARWPDGTVGRPMMCAIQDLYSGKILAWRVDRTANKELVRLTIGDMVETWGIPDHCWLDNGRDFASKWIAGGTPTRYRFKVRDEEPDGILTLLNIQVHWTTPYAGQSKPIERAFRDFATDVAKHPRFAGAYVGNSPTAKPADYGSKAVPIETFIEVIGAEIAAHNARAGRRSAVAQGRSFDVVFAESYERSPIRKATAEQRRLWLLAAEAIGVSRVDGSITLEGNRFWADFLHGHRGQKVAVRFDPQALQEPLHVYRLDGAYLGAAACIEAAGFADADAARAHNQARKAWMRGKKEMAAAERTMTIEQVADMLPPVAPYQPPASPKVVRIANGPAVTVAAPADEQSEDERLMIASVRQLRLVRSQGDELT